MGEEDKEVGSDGDGCCTRACLWRRRRQLLVLSIIVGILTWVVVDQIQKPCIVSEDGPATVQRLYCDGAVNATASGVVVPGQNLTCDGDGLSTEDDWFFDPGYDSDACVREAACLSKGFDTMLDWISANPGAGWLVTVVAYALLTVCLIPGSVLTIGSGVAFGSALGLGKGIAVGTSAVVLGATIGATLAFLMGRFLLRELMEQWSQKYKIIKAMDKAFEHRGLHFVLLLRLSPIIPFNVFNAVMGSSSCSLRNYVVGTFFGIMPGSLAFVSIGALVSAAAFDSDDEGGMTTSMVNPDGCETDPTETLVTTIVLVVGIFATIVAVVLITHYSRRQFQKLKEEEGVVEEDDDDNSGGDQVDVEESAAAARGDEARVSVESQPPTPVNKILPYD